MVLLDWWGKLPLRRTALDCGGDRTCRRRGRKGFPDDCWLRENYGGGLGLLECSGELGVPLYRRSRLAPAVAEDKIAGDHFSVVAGHRGGDERVPTSMRISTSYSQGQLARWCGLGGADHGRSSLPTPACRQKLCQRRCRAPGVAWRVGECSARLCRRARAMCGTRRGRQCDAVARCARAKRALGARPEHARDMLDEMPGQPRV